MEVILRHKKVVIPCIIGFIVLVSYLMVNIVGAQKATAYEVKINGQPLIIAKDKAQVEKEVTQIVNAEEKRIGQKVTLATPPTYHMVLVTSDELTDSSKLESILKKALLMNTSGASIMVNDKPVVYVANEKAGEQVLNNIKTKLTNCGEGEKIAEAKFLEKVTIKPGNYPSCQVLEPEKAITLLETGDQAPIKYTVKEGDNLWMIARHHDTRVANIMAVNNLTTEDLKLDQEILIGASNPFVTVNAVVQGQKTEVIPYSTRIISDKSISTSREKQKGKDGQKEITYRQTKTNGKVIENKILAEKIVSKPVERIVLSGRSGTGYKMTASRGGTHIGGLSWPVWGAITSKFGSRGGTHTGLDIDGRTGDSIKAAQSGKVTYTGRKGTYGLMVTINHGNGLSTRYAHCSKILVNVGDNVSKGEVIAKVGSTGKSTGSHLHFEVIQNGSYQNPQKYLN